MSQDANCKGSPSALTAGGPEGFCRLFGRRSPQEAQEAPSKVHENQSRHIHGCTCTCTHNMGYMHTCMYMYSHIYVFVDAYLYLDLYRITHILVPRGSPQNKHGWIYVYVHVLLFASSLHWVQCFRLLRLQPRPATGLGWGLHRLEFRVHDVWEGGGCCRFQRIFGLRFKCSSLAFRTAPRSRTIAPISCNQVAGTTIVTHRLCCLRMTSCPSSRDPALLPVLRGSSVQLNFLLVGKAGIFRGRRRSRSARGQIASLTFRTRG